MYTLLLPPGAASPALPLSFDEVPLTLVLANGSAMTEVLPSANTTVDDAAMLSCCTAEPLDGDAALLASAWSEEPTRASPSVLLFDDGMAVGSVERLLPEPAARSLSPELAGESPELPPELLELEPELLGLEPPPEPPEFEGEPELLGLEPPPEPPEFEGEPDECDPLDPELPLFWLPLLLPPLLPPELDPPLELCPPPPPFDGCDGAGDELCTGAWLCAGAGAADVAACAEGQLTSQRSVPHAARTV
jgi:hypothetical protein